MENTTENEEESKKILNISWGLITLFIITTIGFYTCNFSHRSLSESPEQWGQIGDYLGGVLNPIISLANLVVLTYITLFLSKNEDKRNKFTLQELAHPLANIICGDYETAIEVRLKNCGLGPMKIKQIIVRNTDGRVTNTLIEQMPENPNDVYWEDFVIDGKDFIIAKDDQIYLIKIQNKHDNPAFAAFRTQLRRTLSSIPLKLNM